MSEDERSYSTGLQAGDRDPPNKNTGLVMIAWPLSKGSWSLMLSLVIRNPESNSHKLEDKYNFLALVLYTKKRRTELYGQRLQSIAPSCDKKQ